jgi:hypothetical protein
MMERLLSYPQAMVFFMRAREKWPQLFDAPRVYYCKSSTAIARPRRNKSFSAESIVNRMTHKEKEMRIFKDFVAELQLFRLDERIREQYDNDSFSPIVHCEVLLHAKLASGGPITAGQFFGGFRYIGCSKPTCKLCQHYFEAHGSSVGYRASHGNLYISWRFPDVSDAQGDEKRTEMVNRLLQRIRNEAFALVRKRVKPTHRNHDSATSSARLTLDDIWTTPSEVDELAAMVGSMGLRDVDD